MCLIDKYQLCLSDRPHWWPLWPSADQSLVPRRQTDHSQSISTKCPWSLNMLMVSCPCSCSSCPRRCSSPPPSWCSPPSWCPPQSWSHGRGVITLPGPGISIPGRRSVNMLMGRLPAISSAHLISCKANSLSQTSCFMNWNGNQSSIFEFWVCPGYSR